MRRTLWSLAVATSLVSTACYHATVETGRPAGSTVVRKPWVSTFIFGLVPAQDINVAAECPNGIARVETQQTFVNGLVGLLTVGIYTPQSATITCAASRTGALPGGPGAEAGLPVVTARDTSLAARATAVQAAADASARTHGPVLVHF